MKIHTTVKKEGHKDVAKCGARGHMIWLDCEYTRKHGFTTNCKRCLGTTERTTQTVQISENMIGKMFHTSWGYDMTINEYAKVIKQTNKSVLLQECYANVKDDYGRGAGKAMAGDVKPNGDTFRLIKKERENYQGDKFAYWAGGQHSSQSWSEWDGQESYHNTWD